MKQDWQFALAVTVKAHWLGEEVVFSWDRRFRGNILLTSSFQEIRCIRLKSVVIPSPFPGQSISARPCTVGSFSRGICVWSYVVHTSQWPLERHSLPTFALMNPAVCSLWGSHLAIYRNLVVIMPLIQMRKLRHVEIMWLVPGMLFASGFPAFCLWSHCLSQTTLYLPCHPVFWLSSFPN